MQTIQLNTVFRYEGVNLPVPEHLKDNREGLKAFHAQLYPAITTADAHEVGATGGDYVIEYRRAVGTKG